MFIFSLNKTSNYQNIYQGGVISAQLVSSSLSTPLFEFRQDIVPELIVTPPIIDDWITLVAPPVVLIPELTPSIVLRLMTSEGLELLSP